MSPPNPPVFSTPRTRGRDPALVIILIAAAIMAVLAGPVLQRFPHSGDEYAYLYQARTFLAGRVVNPPAPDPAALAQVHIVSTADAMYSKYPPGWPAVLAVGAAVHLAFLVNPILVALTLWIAYRLARRRAGETAARVMLVLLAGGAFVLLNGAAFYSHPLVGLSLVLALDALDRYARRPRAAYALLGGGWLGAILLARPQDAVLVGIGLAVMAAPLLGRAAASRRAVHLAAALALPLAAAGIYLLYNRATTGHPFLLGHVVYDPADHPAFDLPEMVAASVNRLQDYLILGTAGLAALLLLRRPPRRPPDRLPGRLLGGLALLAALFWIGYALYPRLNGPPRFGPRYVYPAHLVLVFLAAVGLTRALRRRYLWTVVGAAAALGLVQTAVVAHSAAKTIRAARGPERAAAALARAIAPHRTLVLLEGPAGSAPAFDLDRNDLDYEAPVLFARRPTAAPALADRARYLWDGAGGIGVLTARDPEAAVRAVAITDPPTVIRRGGGPGWLVTSGSDACARFFYAFPGSRPVDWAFWGPCAGSEASVGRPPGPGERWPLAARRSVYAHYRGFFHVDEPGTYTFTVRVGGHAAVRVDGRLLGEWDGERAPVSSPDLGVRLDPGWHAVVLSTWHRGAPGLLEWTARGPGGAPLAPERFFPSPGE